MVQPSSRHLKDLPWLFTCLLQESVSLLSISIAGLKPEDSTLLGLRLKLTCICAFQRMISSNGGRILEKQACVWDHLVDYCCYYQVLNLEGMLNSKEMLKLDDTLYLEEMLNLKQISRQEQVLNPQLLLNIEHSLNLERVLNVEELLNLLKILNIEQMWDPQELPSKQRVPQYLEMKRSLAWSMIQRR